ncbi:hypothetical protein [Streptomyces nigrescens]|uniref:hypothetical protein n=1 Tax=Streptomyces nigrescens TaxID=1920 RepID=UPI0036FAB762
MPNRKRVVEVLTQDVVGAQRFNGLIGECVTMPTKNYDAVQDGAAAILERVARAVDWPRLLEEASFRHMHLHPDRRPEPREWSPAEGVCGECLAEALLADDIGAPNWEKHPMSPREQDGTDWPSIVAANLRHRRAAHWHPFQATRKEDQRGRTAD